MFLAAVGLYDLIAYVVGRSRREIAIRLALGANPRRVTALIIGNGMVLVVAGVAVGMAGAVGAARALETQLFQSSGLDVPTQAAVTVLLLLTALTAAALSTRRAVRVEPQSALRAGSDPGLTPGGQRYDVAGCSVANPPAASRSA